MRVRCVQTNGAFNESTPPTTTWPSTPREGNLLVAGITDNTGGTAVLLSPPSASDWNPLPQATSGSTTIGLFWKRADPGEPTSVASSAPGAVWVAEYGVIVSAAVGADNAQIANLAAVASPAVTPPAGKAGIVIGLLCKAQVSSPTLSSEEINGSATGVIVRYGPHGTDMAAAFCDLFVPSTTGSYEASASGTSGGTGGGAIAVFDVIAAGVGLSMLV